MKISILTWTSPKEEFSKKKGRPMEHPFRLANETTKLVFDQA